jgi:hypothetical protein
MIIDRSLLEQTFCAIASSFWILPGSILRMRIVNRVGFYRKLTADFKVGWLVEECIWPWLERRRLLRGRPKL